MSKRSLALFSLVLTGLFVFAACADPQQPTATPVNHDPTPAGGGAPTAVPTSTPSDSGPTATPSGPDTSAGETVFNSSGCSGCHSTGANTVVGPGMAGIGTTAETRVSGQSADEYIVNSIRNPGDYVVDGFSSVAMPPFPQLSDQDVDNLVAYLKTLQ